MPMTKKILLVDDSSTILMMEKMILEKGRYHLLTAGDGAEAVDKARSERPDLILMDLIMPKVDGFEACRRLREDAATQDIPVIMVTTRGEAESIELAFGIGVDDYVTKPINSLELLAKVRGHLRG
jgi:DNA-binding response OmpR family regulator